MSNKQEILVEGRKLWTTGERTAAMAKLHDWMVVNGTSAHVLVQLIAWKHDAGERKDLGPLMGLLVRHLQLNRREINLSLHSRILLEQLADKLDPTTQQYNPVARFFHLMARSVESDSGPAAAAKVYMTALKQDATMVPAAVGLARCHLAAKDYAECLRCVEAGLFDFPRCIALYRIGIDAANALQNVPLAMSYRQRWLRIQPGKSRLLQEVGSWLHQQGDLEACIELFTFAYAKRKNEVRLLNLLAKLHYELWTKKNSEDHRSAARQLLEQSLAIQAEQPVVRAALARLGGKPAERQARDVTRQVDESRFMLAVHSDDDDGFGLRPAGTNGEFFAVNEQTDMTDLFVETMETEEPDPYAKG